ncbi:MAG: hypothetical protein PHE77_00090 [Candidatus Pacebacteria bacterium]|nr:hypothetical protein [Candidatus Paceibacterota bacterium]
MHETRKIIINGNNLEIWQDGSRDEKIIAVIALTEEEALIDCLGDSSIVGLLLKFFDAGKKEGVREHKHPVLKA